MLIADKPPLVQIVMKEILARAPETVMSRNDAGCLTLRVARQHQVCD